MAAARALALIHGRDYVLPTDVQSVAKDVMAHRIVLGFDAVGGQHCAGSSDRADRRDGATADAGVESAGGRTIRLNLAERCPRPTHIPAANAIPAACPEHA